MHGSRAVDSRMMPKPQSGDSDPLTPEQRAHYVPGVLGALGDLEKRLGIHEGFLADLANQDDWSLVVKTHALVESSINGLLAVYGANPALDDHWAMMPMVVLRRES